MSEDSKPTPPSARAGLTGKRGEYLVALQFALVLLFALTPVWHPGMDHATLAALRPWLLILTLPCTIVAILLAGSGLAHLRENLTPLPYPVDHNRLIQSGAYAFVRHPLYASQLFAALAWTLYNLSLTHLLVAILGFLFFDHKASKEEAWLSKRHPDYPDYARRVKKLIPWIY